MRLLSAFACRARARALFLRLISDGLKYPHSGLFFAMSARRPLSLTCLRRPLIAAARAAGSLPVPASSTMSAFVARLLGGTG
jgi:hypothetical protein